MNHEVAERLRPGAPIEQFDTYLDLVWAWWTGTSIAMLKRDRGPVPVEEMLTVLERIRDQFTRDNLPLLVDVDEIDVNAGLLQDEASPYVHQLKILEVLPVSCRRRSLTTSRRTSKTLGGSMSTWSITTSWRSFPNGWWTSGSELSTTCALSCLTAPVRMTSAKPAGTSSTRSAIRPYRSELGFRIHSTLAANGMS